jgi:hypothetical protein
MLEKAKDRMVIKNVVCIGIGSLYKTENEERSYMYLAALMTVVGYLSKFLHYFFYSSIY